MITTPHERDKESFIHKLCSESFDHLISSCQNVRRNRQSNLLGGFEINHELKLRGLLDREVSGLYSLQDFVHVNSSAAIRVTITRGIGHEPTSFNEVTSLVHGG